MILPLNAWMLFAFNRIISIVSRECQIQGQEICCHIEPDNGFPNQLMVINHGSITISSKTETEQGIVGQVSAEKLYKVAQTMA